MRHHFLSIRSNLARRSPQSALPTRPALERLEDRCVPSANSMAMMGMPMMGMGSMPMQQVGTNTTVTSTTVTNTAAMNTMNNPPSPATLAALNQLFTDFNRTMLQVMSSRNLQQFVANETAMLRIVAADLIHLMATESPTMQGG
jgi:hypothetical protein